MRIALMCLAAVCALSCAALAAHEPASAPVQVGEPVTLGQVELSIKQMQAADTLKAAQEAYAAGVDVDRANPKLHDAYIRKMVKLGAVQAAFTPAMSLTGLDPENGFAWAVAGYMHATRKEYDKALGEMARAAELMPTDPVALNNLGQLVAWQEAQKPPPKLADAAANILKARKNEWLGQDAFKKGYESVKAALAEQVKAADAAKQKIKDVQSELAKARTDMTTAESNIRREQSSIANSQQSIDRLKQDAHVVSVDQRNRRDDSVRRLEQSLGRLQQSIRKHQDDGRAASDKARAKQKELDDLNKAPAAAGIDKVFRFDLTGLGEPAASPASAPAAPASGAQPAGQPGKLPPLRKTGP